MNEQISETLCMPAHGERDLYWVAADGLPRDNRSVLVDSYLEVYDELWEGMAADSLDVARVYLGSDDRYPQFEDSILIFLVDGDLQVRGADITHFHHELMPEIESYESQEYSRAIRNIGDYTREHGIIAAHVGQMVIHPDLRRTGYGVQAPFIRETRLEEDWEADIDSSSISYLPDSFTVTMDVDTPSPEFITSTVMKEKNEQSTGVDTIAGEYGFGNVGPEFAVTVEGDRHLYSLMAKERPGFDYIVGEIAAGDV